MFNILKPHHYKTFVYSSVPAEVVTVTILNYVSFHRLNLLNKQNNTINVLWYEKCSKCDLLALTQVHSRFASHLLPCWWYIVQIQPRSPLCQVTTVVMETMQLVLSQFENLYRSQLRTEFCLPLPKITGKCCELMKLCHINRRGSVFWDAVYLHTFCAFTLCRAVRIELFTARVLYRVSYRVLDGYWTYLLTIGWSKTNGYLVPHSSL